MKALWNALAGVGLVFLLMSAFAVGVSQAHTGSPTPTTWVSNQTLTSQNLNDTFDHIHNTFSGNIVDAHISGTAAIAHSKMATPALLPKAMAVVTANCDGTAAAGTGCVFTGSKVSFLGANGSAGQYCVQLNYTPTDANFVVHVTSHTATSVCIADSRSTGTACGTISARHFLVKCFDYTGAALNNDQFSITVLDDN